MAQRRIVFAVLAGVALLASARAGQQVLDAAGPGVPVPLAPESFAPTSTHGGFVYVSGILPPEPVAPDITAQATAVLDILKARLAGAGNSIDRVVSTSVYLASADDFAALNTAWTQYFPASRPARTTIITRLPAPGARLQVSAIAAANATSRDVIAPAGWATSSLPYSPAIRAGDTVFLAGMISRRGTDNAPVKGDIEVQTRTIFENAKIVLGTAGLTFADVVSSRVYLTNVADFERMNAVYRTCFPSDPPARATVVAGLMAPDYLIEITMTAVKGGPRLAHTTPNADGTAGRPNPVLSSAIGVGPRLFLSGMLGVVQGVEGDAASQSSEALSRLERTMAKAGYGWPQVVDSVVYLTDLSAATPVLDTFRTRAGGRLPAGTLVGAGLVSPAARVEIMLTAGK